MTEEEKENTQTDAEDASSVDEASTDDPVDPAVADLDAPTPNVDRIMNISVPLVVEIARINIRLRKVLSFRPGSVLEFAKKSDDLLDLMVGRARIARGEAVKVGESFGLRVLEVGSLKERIRSLSE